MKRTLLALATAAIVTATVAAQAPQPSQTAPEAATVTAVANALGMLRGLQLRDAILTVEYYATGSQRVFGQASRPGAPLPTLKLTSYKASIAYDAPGMRVELERTNPEGIVQGGGGLPLNAPQKQILVFSGKHAWNESEPGAGLLPSVGTATPAMAAWADRYLEFWMLPHAFVKAARLPNANTRVTSEAGTAVITTNVPEMPGVTMKAWLNAKNLIDRVESRLSNTVLGDTIVEARYSGYKDLGGEENPSDILFPGHIIRTIGGQPVLDIVISKGNTYNPYVIVPVPENVMKAASQTAAPTP